MNKENEAKFNNIIINGLDNLIKNRPRYPNEEFILHLYNQLPEDLKNKSYELNKFCEEYKINK